MKRALFSLLFPLILAACGTATNSGSPTASGSLAGAATITVRGVSLGQILVDGQGKTLYLFEADTSTQSTCSGACAQAWPPFVSSGSPKALGSASPALIGTTRRADGTPQITYNGHPLYYFISDAKPGDTNGEGSTAFGAGWDVVSPAGNKIEKAGS